MVSRTLSMEIVGLETRDLLGWISFLCQPIWWKDPHIPAFVRAIHFQLCVRTWSLWWRKCNGVGRNQRRLPLEFNPWRSYQCGALHSQRSHARIATSPWKLRSGNDLPTWQRPASYSSDNTTVSATNGVLCVAMADNVSWPFTDRAHLGRSRSARAQSSHSFQHAQSSGMPFSKNGITCPRKWSADAFCRCAGDAVYALQHTVATRVIDGPCYTHFSCFESLNDNFLPYLWISIFGMLYCIHVHNIWK